MEDHAVAYFQFANGVRGLLDGGKGLSGGGDMTLLGTAGTIRIDNEISVTLTNKAGQSVETFDKDLLAGWPAVWTKALGELIDWIEGAPSPRIAAGAGRCKLGTESGCLHLRRAQAVRVDFPLSETSDEWPVEELARRAADRGGNP